MADSTDFRYAMKTPSTWTLPEAITSRLGQTMVSASKTMRRLSHLQAVVFLCITVSSAFAHDERVSQGRIWAEPDRWVLEVHLDHDVNESFVSGRIDPAQPEQSYASLADEAKMLIKVEADGQIINPLRAEFRPVGNSGVFKVWYPRAGDGRLELTHNFPDRMIDGEGTVLRSIYDDGTPGKQVFISASHPTETVTLLKNPAPVATEAVGDVEEREPEKPPLSDDRRSQGWFSPVFFKIGLAHIVFGFDHLLFLAGLLVACRKPTDILLIVTSFTLAHSITLSVAALDWWVPPAGIVEPAIAASIVFVGVENLVRKQIGKERAWLTFVFGLIHGFGFAGALREVGLGENGQSIAGPLFAFNAGIEAGQLAIVTIVLPALLWFQHASSRARHLLTPALSIVIALIGFFWLLQRTLFNG